ncbi:MAG: quinone-dependent dihydroorotate dehydrogenase [Candidatus Aenigmarchaeota archaeon]|nr:quinone-dependent dihydroorotate dehydrogenase [Candidatus Aenigmarchaeota archaeon]
MYRLLRPLVFRLGPEDAHSYAIEAGKYLSGTPFRQVIDQTYNLKDKRLETEFCGINFPNPVGLAAGFDKNGELLDFLPSLGFGHIEIGSVTAKPSNGNPKPRIFRLPEYESIINRMGLNNEGADAVYERLKNKKCKVPLGINIAKTNDKEITGDSAIRDYCYTFRKMNDSADYITLNISCPNTEDGRTFQDKSALKELLSEIEINRRSGKRKPVLVKLSPDLTYGEIDRILDISENYGINGYVISNTTKSRDCLSSGEVGGVSGRCLKEKSTEMIRYVNRQLKDPEIIGAGGIMTPDDAKEKMEAGAKLIQIYTGLIYRGPGLVKRINKGLLK